MLSSRQLKKISNEIIPNTDPRRTMWFPLWATQQRWQVVACMRVPGHRGAGRKSSPLSAFQLPLLGQGIPPAWRTTFRNSLKDAVKASRVSSKTTIVYPYSLLFFCIPCVVISYFHDDLVCLNWCEIQLKIFLKITHTDPFFIPYAHSHQQRILIIGLISSST